jgi:hypothetical protein
MKFSELFESTEETLIKRAKHIYTLLKKGVISVECNGPKKISYDLPDNVEFRTIQLKDGKSYPCIELPEEDGEIEWFEDGEKTNCTDYTDELFSILNLKFIKFNVVLLDYNFWIEHPGHDYIEDISQVMGIKYNEEDDEDLYEAEESVNNKLTPTQIKKAKSIYFALKKGTIQIADAKVRYVLPHDFFVDHGQFTGKIIVIPDDNSSNEFPVNLYLIKDNGEETHIPQHNQNLYKKISEKIMKKFSQFGISLVF